MFKDFIITFIIAIQAKDSILVASDTLCFWLDDYGNMVSHPTDRLTKISLDRHHNVCTSNGIHQISQAIFDTITSNEHLHLLWHRLVKITSVFLVQYQAFPKLVEQIQKTTLYCSIPTTKGPRLHHISLAGIQAFQDNNINLLLIDHKNVSDVFVELRQLQQNIKPAKAFDSEASCLAYYLALIKPIFRKMHNHGGSSLDFHIYFATSTHYDFQHIPNT